MDQKVFVDYFRPKVDLHEKCDYKSRTSVLTLFLPDIGSASSKLLLFHHLHMSIAHVDSDWYLENPFKNSIFAMQILPVTPFSFP
jgi:hypothetical protein